jgi:quercetin dioxygenase-like cupin family protein
MTIKRGVLGSIALAAGLAMTLTAGAADAPGAKPALTDTGRVHKYFFSFAGKRPTFVEDGVTNVEVVVPNDKSEGRYNIITAQWNADFQVQPHYHKHHSETFYVLDGEVEWTVKRTSSRRGMRSTSRRTPSTASRSWAASRSRT